MQFGFQNPGSVLATETQCKGKKYFQDAGGRTALHFAAYDGHVEAYTRNLLMEHVRN